MCKKGALTFLFPLLGFCLLLAAGSVAAQNALKQSVVLVTHVDAMPPFTAAAADLLRSYKKNSLQENGVKSVIVLQQNDHLNHFTVVEEWQDQKAYDDHVSAVTTRTFRTDLQPMLGAPFDERSHHVLE